jgi:hypothetical protein
LQPISVAVRKAEQCCSRPPNEGTVSWPVDCGIVPGRTRHSRPPSLSAPAFPLSWGRFFACDGNRTRAARRGVSDLPVAAIGTGHGARSARAHKAAGLTSPFIVGNFKESGHVRMGMLSPRKPLDRFDSMRGTSPPKELKLLVLERVRGKEELLQFLARTRRKTADILQVGLKR